MWRHRILACALLTGMWPDLARAQTPVLIGFLDGDTRAYVRRAFEGAAARLGRSECKMLLTDYSDASGQRLATTLATSGSSPVPSLRSLTGLRGSGRAAVRRGRHAGVHGDPLSGHSRLWTPLSSIGF